MIQAMVLVLLLGGVALAGAQPAIFFRDFESHIRWFEPEGGKVGKLPLDGAGWLDISPDRHWLVAAESVGASGEGLLAYPLKKVMAGETKEFLQLGKGSYPAFSPNGQSLAFIRDGQLVVSSVARGSRLSLGVPRQLTQAFGPIAWSPDGKTIAFHRKVKDGADLWLWSMATSRARRLAAANGTGSLTFSLDSRQLYCSGTDQSDEDAVVAVELSTGKRQTVLSLVSYPVACGSQLVCWSIEKDDTLYLIEAGRTKVVTLPRPFRAAELIAFR